MKRLLTLFVCPMFVLQPGWAIACASLDEVAWMTGTWQTTTQSSRMTEQWERVSENTFEGVGEVFDLESGVLKSRETLRLTAMSSEIFYIAKVAHNHVPVAFKMTSCEGNSAVFENPAHDFPTRIAYQLTDDGVLKADVRGSQGHGFELAFLAVKPAANKRISITFDDAPRGDSRHFSGIERTNALIAGLEKANVPPVLFFSRTLGIDLEGDARMRMYASAGHYIANHSHSHQRPADMGAEAYIEDVYVAHEALQRYPTFVPFFRYPFLDEGKDVAMRDQLRNGLSELGYRNGYVTVDNYDWYMDSIFQKALEQGQSVDPERLGQVYIDVLMQAVRFYDSISNEHLGRSPAHVLLLHENDLAALFIGDLVSALRSEGWTIIDAVEAYQDPIASQLPDTVFNGQGRVAAIAEANGVARRELVHPLEDTGALDALFVEQQVFGPKTQSEAISEK